MPLTPFHLAIQVRDIEEARAFYGGKLGLPEGRSASEWIDFNLFGHQLVTHLNPSIGQDGKVSSISSANGVDGHADCASCRILVSYCKRQTGKC